MQMPNPLTSLLVDDGGESIAAGEHGIDRILEAVRKHLGMDIAFASRFVGGRREFTHINTDIPVPSRPGDSEPKEDTFCYRILKGRLPELILDASEHEGAADLPITKGLPVGAHLNVPLRLSDGSVYGSFCCLSQRPDRSLTPRDLSTMRAFADLAAGQIERELREEEGRQARIARIGEVIDRDSLAMVYQPIVRLDDGAAAGVESLARFADRDSRTPDLWFAEAAGVGLGERLELLAVRQALKGMPYLPAGTYVAVNVSPETMLSPELHEIVLAAAPGRIVVEVTEHSEVTDHDALRAAIARLQPHARIAIDDVGAGYSGLRRIVDLRPDILKLDISLTRDIDRDPARAALAEAMVSFAAGMGCEIVAEGIETAGEMQALRSLGVRYGQGYHLGRPMPLIAARHFLLGEPMEDSGRADAPVPHRTAPETAELRRA